MTIEELQDMWAKDAPIERNDHEMFQQQMSEVDKLRSKYFNILNAERKRAFLLETQRKKLILWLEGYYLKGLYCEELNRKPHPMLPDRKAEREAMIETDAEYVKIKLRIIESDNIITTCVEIIKGLKERGYAFKNLLEAKKFFMGQM